MINHKKQLKKVESTFKELQQEYNNFKRLETYDNRCKLKQKVKEHRDAITSFMSSINNIFFNN